MAAGVEDGVEVVGREGAGKEADMEAVDGLIEDGWEGGSVGGGGEAAGAGGGAGFWWKYGV
jgi:hypothetical protein